MIFETDSVQSFLMSEFSRRVRMNPRYSLRAFSRALGMAPGALSEILRQRRLLSLKAATKVAKALGLNDLEAKRLFELADIDRRKSLGETQFPPAVPVAATQKKLDEDTFHLVSEWYHFAILNLIDCEGFQWKAAHIAKRLGISPAEAQLSMNLLLRLGLVKQKGGQMKGCEDYILSPSGIPSSAIRAYHRKMLEKAIQALDFQSLDEREMAGAGFALDPRHLPRIKREINEFQDQLIAKYSKGKKQEVYFLELALFRITQGEFDGKN